MALTPQDIFEHSFEETRLRVGYDKEQVDTFLDEIQHELRRVIAENESLRDQVHASSNTERLDPQFLRSAGVEPDGFVPFGGADSTRVRQEADQRVVTALHSAEAAESEAAERIERAQEAMRIAEEEARAAQGQAATPAPVEGVDHPAPVEGVDHPAPVPGSAPRLPVQGLPQSFVSAEPGQPAAAAAELLRTAQQVHDEHIASARGRAQALQAQAMEEMKQIEEQEAAAQERIAKLVRHEEELRARLEVAEGAVRQRARDLLEQANLIRQELPWSSQGTGEAPDTQR